MEINQSISQPNLEVPMNMSKFPKTIFFSFAALWTGLQEGGIKMILDTFSSCLFWVSVLRGWAQVLQLVSAQSDLEITIVICLTDGSAWPSLSWISTLCWLLHKCQTKRCSLPQELILQIITDRCLSSLLWLKAIPSFAGSLRLHIWWGPHEITYTKYFENSLSMQSG